MLQRLLAALISLAVVMPSCLVGILVTYQVLLFSLGIGPHDKSTAFIALFIPCVVIGIFAFAMLGYGLLLVALRRAGLEPWFERNAPQGKRSAADVPFELVRALVHRLLPHAGMKP